MPAVTADTLILPRLPHRGDADTDWRPVRRVLTARRFLEGEGFEVRRPFPGVDLSLADPFLLLDHLGAVEYAPGEAKGAPWHPHRGFETVTYIMDGAFEHRDSTGGGGLLTDGATQWMTAGSGVFHSELPPQEFVTKGGLFHGVQLWVNLPATLKWTPPRYQDIGPG
ncbi:MAG: pirin family protein, partial [Acidimicrobiia bacterium]